MNLELSSGKGMLLSATMATSLVLAFLTLPRIGDRQPRGVATARSPLSAAASILQQSDTERPGRCASAVTERGEEGNAALACKAPEETGLRAEESNAAPALPDVLARLNDIVESCGTESPDLEGLGQVARALGSLAQVVPESVQYFDGTKQTVGSLAFSGTQLTASFELDPDGTMSVTVPCPGGEQADYYSRDMRIICRGEGGILEGGTIAVQQQFDVRKVRVLEGFSEQERIVGWVKTTSLSEATHAIPIVGTRLSDRNGIRIGHSEGGHEPIDLPWDADLGPFRSLHELLRRTSMDPGGSR